MTHPEIFMTEIYGSLSPHNAKRIGECSYCESSVYDDSGDVVTSCDGLFCDMDCCCEYYEIRRRFD